ncbi:MAG: glyoxalase superfamily protein [Pseudomonadota bacterium]
MNRDLPTLTDAKAAARQMRQDLAAEGVEITHAQALERIARRHGFRDWNTLYAAIRHTAPAGWSVGGRVKGRYLAHPFEATVLSAEPLTPGWFRLVLRLDDAIDVVRFESFSHYRKQITCVVGPNGHSKERTSDGTPHLVLERD